MLPRGELLEVVIMPDANRLGHYPLATVQMEPLCDLPLTFGGRHGLYPTHEHRRPPLSSLVAHLLKRWLVRFVQIFIALGPPSQAVLMCPVWRSLGKSRKRNS